MGFLSGVLTYAGSKRKKKKLRELQSTNILERTMIKLKSFWRPVINHQYAQSWKILTLLMSRWASKSRLTKGSTRRE